MRPNELSATERATALEPVEVRVMSLLAMGKSNDYIGSRLHMTGGGVAGVIKRCLRLCSVTNAIELACFYLDYVLPNDVVTGHTEPGEKLRAWVEMAKQQYAALVNHPDVRPRHREALEVLADPAHANLSDEELGKRMPGTPVRAVTFGEYIGYLGGALPYEKGSEGRQRTRVRLRLITIYRLAHRKADGT